MTHKIFSCSGSETEHHAHCNQKCEVIELDDLEFELHEEEQAWRAAGMDTNSISANTSIRQ